MSRFSITCGITIGLLLNAVATAEPADEQVTQQIPIDHIWAWRIPGTKDVGTFDAVKTRGVTEHPVLHDVFGGLGLLPKGEKAKPVFVVEGEGKTALLSALAVFKKDKPRSEILPANTELSLVFYSHSVAAQVELVSVDKSASLITVRYRFLSHGLQVNRIHFALIPIGKLAPGTVQAKIIQQDSADLAGNKKPPIQRLERLISREVTFEVRKGLLSKHSNVVWQIGNLRILQGCIPLQATPSQRRLTLIEP